jgi:hypothetical protein
MIIPIIGLAQQPPGVIRTRINPGTEQFYRSHIQGRYILLNGTVVAPLMHISGTVVRKVDDTTLLISQKIDRFDRNMPTVLEWDAAFEENHLALHMPLPGNERPTATNAVDLFALPNGLFRCTTESNTTIVLPGYKVVPTMTFAEYMMVYSNAANAFSDFSIHAVKRAPADE